MGEGKNTSYHSPFSSKETTTTIHSRVSCMLQAFFLRLLLQTFNHLSEENITYKQVYSMLAQVKDVKTLISIIWGILAF